MSRSTPLLKPPQSNDLPSEAGPVLVMAGGTGGHVFPALAVAEELRLRGVPVLWLGTRRGLEARVVPAAGFPIAWLKVAGLRGKGLLTLLMAPLTLFAALLQAGWIILRHRPRAVLGLGGFAAGPGGAMAWLLRRPLVIHEQNGIAGLTNRLLARRAQRVLTGFPDTFTAAHLGRNDAEWVGNPVRPEIAALPPPEHRLSVHSGPLRLLVVGGSLGARALNEVVPQALAQFPVESRPQVRHQSGSKNIEQAAAAYREAGVEASLEPFIQDMAAAYAWADLVICRSGALTVAELAAAGVASILVPYPHAVDDHQSRNARFLSEAGAAVLIQQKELTPEWLFDRLRAFDRVSLLAMAQAARSRAQPDAVHRVANHCLAVAEDKRP